MVMRGPAFLPLWREKRKTILGTRSGSTGVGLGVSKTESEDCTRKRRRSGVYRTTKHGLSSAFVLVEVREGVSEFVQEL